MESPKGPSGPNIPVCPMCGQVLNRVSQGANSYLNSDQFDAIKLGDWFCTTCEDPENTRTGYRYFWDRDLKPDKPQPIVFDVSDGKPAGAVGMTRKQCESMYLQLRSALGYDRVPVGFATAVLVLDPDGSVGHLHSIDPPTNVISGDVEIHRPGTGFYLEHENLERDAGIAELETAISDAVAILTISKRTE